jgi:hypothetical protein
MNLTQPVLAASQAPPASEGKAVAAGLQALAKAIAPHSLSAKSSRLSPHAGDPPSVCPKLCLDSV